MDICWMPLYIHTHTHIDCKLNRKEEKEEEDKSAIKFADETVGERAIEKC